MSDVFSITIKALATVIIVYTMMIPLFKHHSIVNVFDGAFVIISVIFLLLFQNTTNYLGFGMVAFVLLLAYLVLKFVGLKKLNTWHFIFHITFKDKPFIEPIIQTIIDESNLDSTMIVTSLKYPFLFQLHIQDHSVKKQFYKTFENSIKSKFSYLFGVRYGSFLLIFIILAMIWRY